MKKAIITMLVCVNAGLLVALVLGVGTPAAQATFPGSIMRNNTIMITGSVKQNEDALYIIDMASEKLAAFEFQGKGATKRLRAIGSRDLKLHLK